MRREVDDATRTCPGCSRVRIVYLLDTTPRWGGTYDAMQAYAATCDARINVRCKTLPGFVDYDKADLAWIADRLPDAEALMDRAVALGDSPLFLLERANIRNARQEYAQGLADADKGLSLWVEPGLLAARASALASLDRWGEAPESLLAALRIEPTHSHGKSLTSWIAKGTAVEAWNDVHAGHRDEGLRLFDLAADLLPLDRDIQVYRARALLGDDDHPDIAAIEAQVKQNPDDLRLHQRLDYALSEKRDFARIAAMWTEYIDRHPDDARAHMERSGTYFQLGRHAEANADALKACELGINEGCMRAQ